jgi:AcrR family transcriptional regulator
VPRAGVTRERIATVAGDLADELGLEAVTLSAVAARLGVSGPAMYKHVAGLDAVRRDVGVAALGELTDAIAAAAAGRSGADALRALADAYRAYGREHPGRLAASVRAPAAGDAEHAEASDRAIGVLQAVLRGYAIEEGAMVDAVRALRAALHGFAVLDAAGGFGLPRDVEATYERYVALLDTGLRSWAS